MIKKNKISPYISKTGQQIITNDDTKINLKQFIEKIDNALKNKNISVKFDKEFIEIIQQRKLEEQFTFIELYHASKLKDSKILDYLYFRFSLNKASTKFEELPVPLYLLVEPVSACNLKCPMCFQIDKSFTRKPFMGVMQWDLFTKVVDEASEIGVKAITLASRGEPTLHPQFSKMLEYISKKDCFFDIKINTNATFLTNEICHAIFKSNVSTIVISADHYEKKTFEILRKNANFEKIIKNVKNLFNIRKKNYPNSDTEIRVSGVDYYKNLDRKKFIEFWQPYSDIVTASYAEERWDTYNNKPTDINTPCSFLWDRMYVWYDGKCNPCDNDYKSYLSYGNATKNSLIDIWNSKALKDIRNKHLNNQRNKIVPCDRCGVEFNK